MTKKEKKLEAQTAVATKTPNPVVISGNLSEWGEHEVFSTSITIPRILKMEFMSEKVKAQEAKFGEFRDSLSGELYGDLEHPFEIIPIEVQEKWAIYDLVQIKGKTKREFKEIIAVTHQNENWKYSEGAIERDRIIDVYCLLPKDVADLPEDWEAMGLKPLPKIVGFRRTSLRAGKKVNTQMYVTNRSKGLSPPSVIVQVSVKSVDGQEDGTYGVMDTKPTRMATEREQKLALIWFKAIRAGQTKPDDSELVKDVEETTNVSEIKDY